VCGCSLQPEVFENPLFIAALDSVASRLLTLSQAADKFGIRESALKAAVTWSDVVQRSDVLTTSAAAAVSTHSNQVFCLSLYLYFIHVSSQFSLLAAARIKCYIFIILLMLCPAEALCGQTRQTG